MPVASAGERTRGSTTEQLLGGCPMCGNPLFLKSGASASGRGDLVPHTSTRGLAAA